MACGDPPQREDLAPGVRGPASLANRGVASHRVAVSSGQSLGPFLCGVPLSCARYVSDYLPTFLDLLGQSHPQPDWAADGMSLLPLIRSLATSGAQNDTSARPSTHPLVFELGQQAALIDNDWKILENPHTGICEAEAGSVYKGRRLFNLRDDPTESLDRSALNESLFQRMSVLLDAFKESVKSSQVSQPSTTQP